MSWTWIAVLVSLAALGVLGLVCLATIAFDRRTTGRVSERGAAMIWTVYLGFTAVAAASSWLGLWPMPVSDALLRPAGAVLAAAGAGLLIAGLRAFNSMERTMGRGHTKLVRTGIYAWSRNPQNVGWGAALAGFALMGGSGFGLLLAGVFFVAERLYVPTEERHLEREFGAEWRDYAASVPRFFGIPVREGRPARTRKDERLVVRRADR